MFALFEWLVVVWMLSYFTLHTAVLLPLLLSFLYAWRFCQIAPNSSVSSCLCTAFTLVTPFDTIPGA